MGDTTTHPRTSWAQFQGPQVYKADSKPSKAGICLLPKSPRNFPSSVHWEILATRLYHQSRNFSSPQSSWCSSCQHSMGAHCRHNNTSFGCSSYDGLEQHARECILCLEVCVFTYELTRIISKTIFPPRCHDVASHRIVVGIVEGR